MRSVAYALMTLTAGVLMASPASAGCYGGPCGDGYRGDGYGYQSAPPTTYYNSGPAYDNGYGGERVYSSGPIESYTVRPSDYGVKYTVPSYDEGYDSYGHYDRPYRSYGYGGGYYERPYRSYSYNGGYGYDRPYYRPYRSYYGYGGGSGYYGYDRPYYRSYGYGYGGGYRGYYSGYGGGYYGYRPTAYYGGGWSQTAAALGYGYGYGGGCHTAYIPYGWTWYKSHSC